MCLPDPCPVPALAPSRAAGGRPSLRGFGLAVRLGEGDVAGQGEKPTVVRVTVLKQKPEWTSGVGLRWTET